MTIYLTPSHGQKSFYNKAIVISKNNVLTLKSYNTIIATIDKTNNKLSIFGYFSKTTALHLNSFLIQNGFKSLSKKEIENYKNI